MFCKHFCAVMCRIAAKKNKNKKKNTNKKTTTTILQKQQQILQLIRGSIWSASQVAATAAAGDVCSPLYRVLSTQSVSFRNKG